MKTRDCRIVFTGIGVVSPIGIGKDAFWNGLRSGKSGVKKVSLFDTDTCAPKSACEISDFKPEEIIGSAGLRNLDRTTKLALCASKLALADADFSINESNAHDVGVVLGSTMGSIWSISEFDKEALRNGPRSVNPALFPNTVFNSPASQISIRFGIKGFNSTISAGFTSVFSAIEYAATFIRLGRANAVLVGGVEELCEQLFKGLCKVGFLSNSNPGSSGELLAPFDKRRNGTVLGEGSAMFLIEDREHAIARNAKIYGEIKSTASVLDRAGIRKYNPRGEGLKKAIYKSISGSGLGVDDIHYVSSSANSTVYGDFAESNVVKKILGNGKRKVLMSASKSMIGETFSASGAFQVASGLMAFSLGTVHPTINHVLNDKRCDIDCIPNTARDISVDNLLVSCISPMGQNSAMVLSRDDQ